ncbi:MAG: hypothetical protein E6I65_07790 [Chloroflexi bacterium]|nr:MAG: hypothetical protein E6I65_07790 [Chloroflexota bacterium]
MRIYEGSPRQDWEEVLRSVGAYLDDRGMRGMIFIETDTGFIVQGTSVEGSTGTGESMGQANRETLTLHDDDVSRFMDEAVARRGKTEDPGPHIYEQQLRVIGRYLDSLHPRDIFFFEVDGSYIARITIAGQGALKQELIEFTAEDIADLIAKAPELRRTNQPPQG